MAVPVEIEAAWELWPGLEPYQIAFRTLDAERDWNSGMAGSWPYPIKERDLRAYALNHEFARPYTKLQRFLILVKAQDSAWMQWYYARRKK